MMRLGLQGCSGAMADEGLAGRQGGAIARIGGGGRLGKEIERRKEWR
jgi:hypothetical protein